MATKQLRLLTASRVTRSSEIRDFIVRNVDAHPRNIAKLVEDEFRITRQAAVNRLRQLVDEGLITAKGNTKARTYALRDFVDEVFHINVDRSTAEDVEWRTKIAPLVDGLPSNVVDVCHHGFTEMFNNVIDHSGSAIAHVLVTRNALRTRIKIEDSGIGIFKKIQADFGLTDPRHALLELCKGKLTSDPSSHTGEGIFFTSRMFDTFMLWSGNLVFTRTNKEGQDWLVEVAERESVQGTLVQLEISNESDVTTKEVFDRFAPGSDDYGFSKTIVPVRLAQYEGEKLISRSQAKRLVAHFDRFAEVILDFRGVTEIGQAFADEIFRVYRKEHPTVHLYPVNAAFPILKLIQRAQEVS